MAKKDRLRVYFCVGDDEPGSTPWHLWIDNTSAYLLNFAIGGLKVSLHGADPRHPGGGRFQVRPDAIDGEAPLVAKDVEFVPPADGWPCYFTGRQTSLGIFAIRIRVTRRACDLGSPRATMPKRQSSADVKAPLPATGLSSDLDLTFEQLPKGFVPVNDYPSKLVTRVSQTRLVVALGDAVSNTSGFRLEHDLGVVLRAETRGRREDSHPTPSELTVPRESGKHQAARSIRMDVVDEVLWIVEDAVGASEDEPETAKNT